ncbi:hypothetical protein GMOD_00006829 [Pyrenophora seminiperda CCB06]|uniref:Uncharacterized protein n=1 Tax=Pyrenophora seminiperda CCB06 TaxID=1302712 RepID=A0A3M7MB35_9PLEO|nr:hypothetical protein GMOD_00006829 [Pyrenophora seminiperda CCB06]
MTRDDTPMDMDYTELPRSPVARSPVPRSPVPRSPVPRSPANSTKTDSTQRESTKSDRGTPFYTDAFPTLPSTGPPTHAHILNLNNYASSAKQVTIKLQDAIATTLFNISPATLEDFVNPTVNTFKAIFGKKDVQLVIWRKGIEVFVYRFERVAGCLIGYDGAWHLKTTLTNGYAAVKWSDVWNGKFECQGGVAKMRVDYEEVGRERSAEALGAVVIVGKYWELKTVIKMS